MAFAQTTYDQIQGINGKYTIHDIGCFLTSFSNLELDYGKAISPLDINNILVQRNLFIDVDDGVRDDVDWNFVNYIDPDTRVARRGSNGWPNSNQAIVKFAYTSPRTQMRTTHFCKVADYANKMILDSWDGVVKHISSTWYGEPVEWAIYEHGIVAPPSPPQPRYTVVETYNPGKQIKLNKQPTYLWGMNYDFNYMVAHPVEKHDKGEVWTVTNKVHHEDGYDYYRREGQVDGFNVNDCDDYISPATPYVPPTAPLTVPKPTMYQLVTTVPYFDNQKDAQNDTNAKGTVDKGTYIELDTVGLAKKLSKTNTDTATFWINTLHNTVAPEPPIVPVVMAPTTPQPVDPAPIPNTVVDVVTPVSNNAWKVTHSLRADGKPVLYDAINPSVIMIRDLDMKQEAITMQPYNDHKPVPIVSTFVKDGVTYGRAQKVAASGWWYGISMDYLHEHHKTIVEEAEHDVLTWGDFFENGFKSAQTFTKRIIADITPVQTKALSARSKQLIDGLKKGQHK